MRTLIVSIIILILFSCSNDDKLIVASSNILVANTWEPFKFESFNNGVLDATFDYHAEYRANEVITFTQLSPTGLKYTAVELIPYTIYESTCTVIDSTTFSLDDGTSLFYSVIDNTFLIVYIDGSYSQKRYYQIK